MSLTIFVKEETTLLEYTAKDQKMCLRIFLKEKAFLDYKNIDWKIRKFDIFPKGFGPWFWSKIWKILERKSLSKLRKHRLKKVKKRFFFPKGLVHDFGQKFKLFRSPYLRQSRARKCVSRCSLKKKQPF